MFFLRQPVSGALLPPGGMQRCLLSQWILPDLPPRFYSSAKGNSLFVKGLIKIKHPPSKKKKRFKIGFEGSRKETDYCAKSNLIENICCPKQDVKSKSCCTQDVMCPPFTKVKRKAFSENFSTIKSLLPPSYSPSEVFCPFDVSIFL